MADISAIEYLVIAVIGLIVGVINAMAGGASILVYTALISIGFNPVAASVTTAWGVTPANLVAQKVSAGTIKELYQENSRLLWFSIVGTIIGAVALLNMPISVLEKAVPVLLLIAGLSVLIPVNRKIGKLTKVKEEAIIFATGLYCGYFGPGQGVMVAATLARDPRRKTLDLVGLKNFITGYTAIVSNLIFLTSGQIHWRLVVLLGLTSGFGGWLGSRAAVKMSPLLYRALLLSVGVGASIWFFKKYW
jgi:uncharacterized membrane protein YfcA